MKLLFKCTGVTNDQRTIKNSNFKKHYPSVNGNMSWDNIEPYIRAATDEYIIPYLGQSFYDVLEAHYDTGSTDTVKDLILEKIQDAIAFYTIYDAMPHLNGVISDLGVRENNTENSLPVTQWRYKSMRWNSILKGDRSLDNALAYMEDNLDNTFLTTWKDSEAYNCAGHILFRTTADLKKYLHIDGRRAFISLVPYLKKSEPSLMPILCNDQYDDLITKLKADSLSDKEKEVIEKCRHIISAKAMQIAVPHISVIYEGNGFKLVSRTDAYDTKSNLLTTSFSKEGVSMIRAQLEEDMNVHIDDLERYLYSNVDDFPLWKDDMYEEDPESTMITASDDCVGGIMI